MGRLCKGRRARSTAVSRLSLPPSPPPSMLTYPVTTSVLPSLRRGGVKVRIRHERYVYCTDSWETITGLTPYGRRWEADKCMIPFPNGGKTTVDLAFPDGSSCTGTALCSLSDRFCRRTGIAIALDRALAQRKVDRIYVDLNAPPPNHAAREAYVRYQEVCADRPIPYNPTPSATIHPR